ncbi:MAG: hypothetical protein IJA34_10965 [Lachnospiraceae bacterium]|nr:hypothetical protein [Lachnospiraceae bacterium]
MPNIGKLNFKDRSTLSKGEYLGTHIYYSIIFSFVMYNTLPILVKIAYFEGGIIKLIICMVVSNTVGIVFTYSHDRTYVGVFIDVASGMGGYIALTVGKYFFEFIYYLFCVTGFFTLICMFIIFHRRIEKKNRKKQIVIIRCLKCIQVIRWNIGIALFIILIILPVSLKFIKKDSHELAYDEKIKELSNDDMFQNMDINEELIVNKIYGDEYRLSENIDKIKAFRYNETFQALTYEQKCEAIEALIYCEARYQGLCEIDVVFKELEEGTAGKYNHAARTIFIDSKIIKDGSKEGGSNEEIMRTCIHETRHVYQHLLAELYADVNPNQRNLLVFTENGVRNWIFNFKDYYSATDDIEGIKKYLTQPIELDARNYAENEMKEYFEAIDELLEE